jgi:hypothetical protein
MTKRLTPARKKPTVRSEIVRLQGIIDILIKQAIQSHENIVALDAQVEQIKSVQSTAVR